MTLIGLVLSPALYTLLCGWLYMDLRPSGDPADGPNIVSAAGPRGRGAGRELL